MKPLRVLLDAHMVGERETGNETYIANLARALRARPDEVLLSIAVAHPEAAQAAMGPPDENCRYVRVSESPWRRLAWELPRLATREQADLLHVTYTGPLASPCPMVVTIHDVAYRIEPRWFSPRDRFVLAAGIGLTARRAARIITVSAHAKSEIVRELGLCADRIDVTLEAAAPHYRRMDPAKRAAFDLHTWGIRNPFVLAVGNLQPRKNLQRLVEAFARVIQRHPSLPHQLVLVGKAQWRESELFQTIEREGLRDRIVFTGYVPDETLVGLFNTADLVAYPSLYEGFGLPVLEAMACGAPVLTSAVSSLPEVAGDAAALVDPLQIDSITEGMSAVLTDPGRRADLAARSLERAACFSWAACADATIAAYRAAMR